MNEETAAAKAQKTTMQNVVQQMLPDDLKKQFVLQKNTEGGLEKAKFKPITFDPSGNVATPAAPQLDPNLVQKAIRTFESDFAEIQAEKQGSASSFSIAEKKKKEEESRAAEMQQAAPVAPPVQRVYAKPVAPTTATAIPGATISIPPSVAHDLNLEIEDALRAAQPPQPEPVPQPVQPQPIPVPQPTPVVQPVSHAEPIPPQAQPVPVRKTVVFQDAEAAPSHVKPILLMLISIALIGGGLYEGYVLYKKTVVEAPIETPDAPLVIPSVIPHDAQVSVPLANETGNALITKLYTVINKNSVSSGKNLELLLTKNSGAATMLMGGTEFVQKLNTQMPDVIFRSLTDRWMFGVYGEENGQKTTFMALTTDFFQNAFAGMLNWEDNAMPDDLALLLNFKDRAKRDDLAATSTIASYFTIKGTFSDKVIKNRDVREFRNTKGELLFLYSFINKETLLLTTTESSFIALVDRIEKDAYVR
jgi:hypothetical protein